MKIKESEIHLPITGMACPSCAAHVERVVGTVSGVSAVDVHLASSSARVRYRNGSLLSDELVRVVQEAGYGVPTESIDIGIVGMTCVSCAAHVEGALADIPGVVQAAVNLSTERAMVTYITGLVDRPDFQRAVEEIGYELQGAPGAQIN